MGIARIGDLEFPPSSEWREKSERDWKMSIRNLKFGFEIRKVKV